MNNYIIVPAFQMNIVTRNDTFYNCHKNSFRFLIRKMSTSEHKTNAMFPISVDSFFYEGLRRRRSCIPKENRVKQKKSEEPFLLF
jgi:hypothetical protein